MEDKQNQFEFNENRNVFLERVKESERCLGVILSETGENSMILLNANVIEIRAMIMALMMSDHDIFITIRNAVIEYEQSLTHEN